jgi:hypothetical protein
MLLPAILPMTEEAPGESPQERIDATFRNGSVTAVASSSALRSAS